MTISSLCPTPHVPHCTTCYVYVVLGMGLMLAITPSVEPGPQLSVDFTLNSLAFLSSCTWRLSLPLWLVAAAVCEIWNSIRMLGTVLFLFVLHVSTPKILGSVSSFLLQSAFIAGFPFDQECRKSWRQLFSSNWLSLLSVVKCGEVERNICGWLLESS